MEHFEILGDKQLMQQKKVDSGELADFEAKRR
jgi:hypothetical protein